MIAAGIIGTSVLSAHLTTAQPITDVLRATTAHFATQVVKGHISLDPRLMVSEGRPFPLGNTAAHKQADIAPLASAEYVTLVSMDRAVACDDPSMSQCKTNGVANFLMLSEPRIVGDSAFVQAYLRTAKDPTAADSAKARSGSNGQMAVRMLGRPSGATYLATLVNEKGSWQIAKLEMKGRS